MCGRVCGGWCEGVEGGVRVCGVWGVGCGGWDEGVWRVG